MMKKHRTPSMLLGLGALGLAGAAGSLAHAGGAAVASMQDETSRGKITEVQLDYHNFTIEVKGKPVQIFITEDTKYTIGGKPGKKADALKVGAKVKVKHSGNVASNVEVE